MSEYSPELGPYNTQVQQASNHTEKLVATIGTLALGLGSTRAVVNGAAADFQHYTAGMAAAARVTGQSYGTLTAGVRQLARDLPIGQKAAADMVASVQQIGLTSKGQEGQVLSLAKTMTQLTAATGQVGPGMSQGFLQLNRQMASLDPDRVRRFSDELVKASTIAPVGNVVEMARQIAPAAQASGMGMSAVQGLSTAFAKTGDDSFVAVNAVNKMLTDLNRSVHEGTPEMARYASALGMTAQEFKNMYQNNPTDAVNALVNAVGKAGPQSMRILDELGIGSPRAQRAFLDVAQSGGLQPVMNQVMGAYGSGSTESASRVAFNNVQDSMTRLGNAASQVAQTFERPLLNATNNIVKAAGLATRIVGSVVSSGPIGGAMNIATQAALPLLMARMGMRALNTGALASVLVRSTYVGGTLAGFRASHRGGIDEALEGRGPRSAMTRDILQRAQYGSPLADNEVAAGRIGKGMEFGSFLGSMFPPSGGGVSLMQRARGIGAMGLSFLARGQSELYRIARTAPTERDPMMVRGFTQPHEAFAARLTDLRDQVVKKQISPEDALRGSAEAFKDITEKAGEATPAMKEMAAAVKALGVEGAVTGAAGLKGLAVGAGKGLMGMMGGPIGMTMMAGFAGYQMYQSSQEGKKRDNARLEELFSPDNSLQNRYNDAIGLAAQNTQSFADALARSSDKVANATTTMAQAISGPSTAGADAGAATPVTDYHGTTGQVAAAIQAGFPNKMSPPQVARVRQDLKASGYSDKDITSILTQATSATPGATTSAVTTLATQAGQESASYTPGIFSSIVTNVKNATSGALPGQPGSHPGDTGIGIVPGAKSKKDIDQMAQDISTQFQQIANDTSGKGGTAVAVQWLFRTVNAAMAALQNANDDGSAFAYGSKVFSKLLTGLTQKGRGSSRTVSRQDFASSGAKTFSQWMDQQKGTKYGQYTMAGWAAQGANPGATTLTGPGPDQGVISQANLAAPSVAGLLGGAAAAGISPSLIQSFRTGQQQGFNNTGLTNVTAQQMLNAAMAGGTKPGDFAAQMVALGARDQDLEPQTQAAGALGQQAFQRSLSGMSQPEALQAQAQNAQQALARLIPLQQEMAKAGLPSDDALNQAISDYTNQLDSVQDAEKQSYQARIMAQYDFQKNMARAQEQFGTQVARFNRDYQLQLKRQNEDAAKSMYNPYQRIQAQPVWDVQNLLGNEREQITAMRNQVKNINELKRLGLSQQAIDQLSLYDPTKAQQVQEMVGELKASRGEVRQLNQVAAQRQQVSGQLHQQDPQVRRAAEDHRRQLSDMRKDNARQMRYMREDNREQDLALTGDLTTLQKDMNKILHGQHVDLSKQLHSVWKTTLSQASSASSNLKSLFAGIVPQNLLDALALLDTGGKASTAATANTDQGQTLTMSGGSGAVVRAQAFAAGGIATKPMVSIIAENAPHEGVIPLDAHGARFFANVMSDLGVLRGGGHANAHQIVHETHVYDQGQHIHGPVTVKANTPAEWANQARAVARKTNLTAPRSVRWARTASAA